MAVITDEQPKQHSGNSGTVKAIPKRMKSRNRIRIYAEAGWGTLTSNSLGEAVAE